MSYRDGSIFIFDQKRLAVFNARPTRGRISDMTNSYLTSQERKLGIVKDLGNETHTPMSTDGLAIMHRYACRLLSSMLQGIQGVVNGFGYVIARLIEGNPNNAAGIVQL
jgi:hypothetical protein